MYICIYIYIYICICVYTYMHRYVYVHVKLDCVEESLAGCRASTLPSQGPTPDRGTLRIRNSAPLGPYSSPMPRDLWWS